MTTPDTIKLRTYLVSWLAAYPEEVFEPIAPGETASLKGLSDRIAAHAIRHVLKQMLKDLDGGELVL